MAASLRKIGGDVARSAHSSPAYTHVASRGGAAAAAAWGRARHRRVHGRGELREGRERGESADTGVGSSSGNVRLLMGVLLSTSVGAGREGRKRGRAHGATGAAARGCSHPLKQILLLLTTMSFSKMKKVPTEEEACLTYSVDSTISRAVITDKTRGGHTRIVKAYIAFHMRKDPEWYAKRSDRRDAGTYYTVYHPKCGEKAKGCEGKKYATAVSTRAALTYWYRTIRPNESVTEWRIDSKTGEWLTTSFEKTKAKAGEVSVSARALSLSDMHNLYDLCFRPNATPAEMRWSITAYLFAWLLLLRFEEVVRIQFESINIIPGSRMSSLFIHLLECLLLPFQGESFEVKMFTRKSECASHFQRVTALLLVDAGGSRWEVKVW
ncbi:hypothetical protein B0H14DRAFT_3545100 [Mycena olivaceomarginata]|nr:hypothetical protein B0H14DRAFT_3545100 [Mycena olivaceomarginata]